LYRSKQLLLPVSVLELEAESGTLQFGFNPWVNIAAHLPIKPSVEVVRLGVSPMSLLLRLAIVLLLLQAVWRYFS
jgi:hypothetical protein